jgi:hypothetical protein
MKISLVVVGCGHGMAASTPYASPTGGAPVGGGATAPGRRPLRGRHRPPAGRQPRGAHPMEPPVGPSRAGGTPPAASARPAPTVDRRAMGAAPGPAPAGRRGRRVRDRALDAATHRPRGRADLRGPVPRQCAQPGLARAGLESAAALAPGHRARRGAHRCLAATRLAPHKKGARHRGRAVAFLDETGHTFRARVGTTWAPRASHPSCAE